jgi:hypothetical protein
VAITTQEALDALGVTQTQIDNLKLFADALASLNADPSLPNADDTVPAIVKVGGAISVLDAASVAAGGTGYSADGLATGIAISGLSAQITSYEETVAAQRAQAVEDNQSAETALQTDLGTIATLSAKEEPTTDDLVALAGLQAKIKRVRGEQTARTEAAEAFAQTVAPIITSLKSRLRRLATGDLTAV